MPVVFVPQDLIIGELLDDIAAALAARGCEIVRGPESLPGKKVEFPRERWDHWFGRADVAMFSSRNPCTREMLEAMPRLRAIVNPAIGLELVDVTAAGELGIIVGNGATPENVLAMAESTVMLMLNCLYQPRLSEDVMRGRRPRPRPGGRDVWASMARGKTIGLVGFGSIARAVAERLAGWQIRMLATTRGAPKDPLPPHVELTDLDTLLRASDLVSIHVSINASSRGMIDSRALSLMRPGAWLINTARGDAIDEPALIDALKAGRIAGAALDVTRVEPLPADSPLRAMDNVYLTPHMVGHAKEVFSSLIDAAVENITRVLDGRLPRYCKNPEIEPRWRERLARLGPVSPR